MALSSYKPAWKKFGSGKEDKESKLVKPEDDEEDGNMLPSPEDEKDNEDGEEPLKDGKMTVHIEHKDGTKSDHEYEGLK